MESDTKVTNVHVLLRDRCIAIPILIHSPNYESTNLKKIIIKILFFLDRPECGKMAKATSPRIAASGVGPSRCGFIVDLNGIKAGSRKDVKGFCESVLGVPIATSTIQKIIDRASEAIAPAYHKIGDEARSAHCN